MGNRAVIFPGSFDPFTVGHKEIVERALTIFDRVVVAVGENSEKSCLYSVEERVESIRRCFAGNPRVEVLSYDGLTADLCKRLDIYTLLRGIRDTSDWNYENRIAGVNRLLDPRIETLFLPSSPHLSSISSSLVRELLKMGGNVQELVP